MKIAVCIPHNGNMRAAFGICLGRMLLHSGRTHDLELFEARGSSIAGNRESIAERALAAGADYLFWLDTDHIFPPDILERLLRLKLDVVGCNYPRRWPGAPPTASIVQDGKQRFVVTTREEAEASHVQQVHAMGLGVCLVRGDVMRRMERPWFSHLKAGGEDSYFFGEVARLGIPVFIDHATSWEVGHLAEVAFTNADVSVPDEDRWERPGAIA